MPKARKIQKESPVMEKLLGDDLQIKQFTQGEIIEGIVVSASPKEILLDVGAKSEGIVNSDEIGSDEYIQNLRPGDTALAYVMQAENDQGYIVLSS